MFVPIQHPPNSSLWLPCTAREDVVVFVVFVIYRPKWYSNALALPELIVGKFQAKNNNKDGGDMQRHIHRTQE